MAIAIAAVCNLLRSPHLLSLRERIAINGRPITAEDFDGLVGRGLEAARASPDVAPGRVSHFEMMTALALRHFQQQQVPQIK